MHTIGKDGKNEWQRKRAKGFMNGIPNCSTASASNHEWNRQSILNWAFCFLPLSLSLRYSSLASHFTFDTRWTKYRPIKFDLQTMWCQLNRVPWQRSIEMRQFTQTEIFLGEMKTTNDAFTRFNHIKWLSFGHREWSETKNNAQTMVGILKLINQLWIVIILNKIIKSPQSPSWN